MPKIAITVRPFTDAEKLYVEQHYRDDPRDIAREIFQNPNLDGRSAEVKAVRAHLATLGQMVLSRPDAGTGVTDLIVVELDQAARDHIERNYRTASGPLEMAREIFNDPTMNVSSPQCRAVTQYCKQLDPYYAKGEDLAPSYYTAPKDIKALLKLMEKYALNTKENGQALFDPRTITKRDAAILELLTTRMALPLFAALAEKFQKRADRELFEFTFIWLCWDKPDLLSEETHQYMTFASETVKQTQIERRKQLIDSRLDDMLSSGTGKVNYAEVELLTSIRDGVNESLNQQAKLLKVLVGDRSKRMGERVKSNGTMHQLVEAWKQEDKRRRLIEQANKRREELGTEIVRLSELDSVRAEFFGLSESEILK